MRYEVIFATYRRRNFGTASHRPVDRRWPTRFRRLEQDPVEVATYSPKTDRWTSHFGDWGVIEYNVHATVVRVVVLRVIWSGG